MAEQADRLLRQMGDYVGSADDFTFHADINFDHVLPSGQKLQYTASEDVALQRPNRLCVDVTVPSLPNGAVNQTIGGVTYSVVVKLS